MYALTLPIYPLDKKFEIQYFFWFLRPIIIVSKPGPLEQVCTCSFKSLLVDSCCISIIQDQTTEVHRVPLKTTHGGKKRNVVSVADPTDILTNLHLPRYPLEQSSELTQGLGPDDVRRLNNRQRGEERYSSPPDRLKLFSFSKRHLRLPFSRGKGKREEHKGKREKHVKLPPPPATEKTSPRRRGSRSEPRNRRLSRNQPGETNTPNRHFK